MVSFKITLVIDNEMHKKLVTYKQQKKFNKQYKNLYFIIHSSDLAISKFSMKYQLGVHFAHSTLVCKN